MQLIAKCNQEKTEEANVNLIYNRIRKQDIKEHLDVLNADIWQNDLCDEINNHKSYFTFNKLEENFPNS